MQAKALWIKAWASGSKSRLSKACNLQDRKQVFCPFHPLENIMDMLPQENKYHGFACDLKASRMHQLLTHCFHSFQMSFLNMAANNLRMLSVATSRPGPCMGILTRGLMILWFFPGPGHSASVCPISLPVLASRSVGYLGKCEGAAKGCWQG